jgi:hypothetical protein
MVELGWRGLNIQWTARSWKWILEYRRWAPPRYASKPNYRLTAVTDTGEDELLLQTPQYRLWHLK